MLKIGEFAALTGISINMLRNYDKIGLLVPEQVDEENSYRYYSEGQIILANQIHILKELGFGLKEIPKLSHCKDNDVRELIEKKVLEKQNEKKRIEEQIQRMQQTVSNLDRHRDLIFAVKIVSLPARKVVALRANIKNFEEEGLLWEKLERACIENNVKVLNNDYSYAITYNVDFEKSIIDTEVQKTVREIPRELQGISSYEIPPLEAAMVSVKGVYSRVGDISSYVHKYIKGMNYEIREAPTRRYLVSPNDKCDPREYITEYYYPLNKV